MEPRFALQLPAGWLLVGLVALLMVQGGTAAAEEGASHISLYYYGDIGCAHCDTFESVRVPQIEAEFDVVLDVTAFDIMRGENRSVLRQELTRYGQQYRIFPVLLVGNNAYQGNAAIEMHLPLELEHLLQTGSFRPRLPAEQATAVAAPPSTAPPATPAPSRRPALLYFWAEGCPACGRAEPFLDQLQHSFPELLIERYEVSRERANLQRFRETAELWGTEARAVPAFFLPGRYWIGYSETIASEISAAVQVGLAADWSELDSPHPSISREYVNLPLFGRIALADAPAFVVTGAIAAVDGFNPCSLWVLTFLIGLIVRTGSRRRTLAVGAVFLLVTASVYGLFIVGLFSAFAAAGGVLAVRIVVAVLAISMGMIHVKDFFAFKTGLSLTIPQRFHPAISRWGRSVFSSSGSPLALVAATVLFALGISIVELPCTAGFPLIWSQYVASLGAGGVSFAMLLTLYLLVYLAAEIIVVVVSVVCMQRLSFGETQARVLKLFGGTIMVALGATYLVIPHATRTMNGIGWMFGLALLVTLMILLVSRLRPAALEG
ncbi:MAG: hypothetical protein EA384_11880 [Spirochaetaceae bacterium]|nr:MAG: hypothetical protein EA384_11880 [Spirochaetaceae bacterium]